MSKEERWVLGFIYVASGLALILSFGNYAPSWVLDYVRASAIKRVALARGD